jgi:hypothetical protein
VNCRAPFLLRDDILVIFEGSRRLIWRPQGRRDAVPELWPQKADIEWIARRRNGGRPILVLLEEPPARLTFLPEEVEAFPKKLLRYVRPTDGGLFEFVIPFLDWLPEDVRGRAQILVRRATALRATSPTPLLPAWLFETDVDSRESVRFAFRLRPHLCSDADVAALAAYARGSLPPLEPAHSFREEVHKA